MGIILLQGETGTRLLPDFKSDFAVNKTDTTQMVIPIDYLTPDWKWLYDNRTPSERNVLTAYDPSSTTTNIFDFFLISPNIVSLSVEGIQLNFENSDHNPVRIKIKLQK